MAIWIPYVLSPIDIYPSLTLDALLVCDGVWQAPSLAPSAAYEQRNGGGHHNNSEQRDAILAGTLVPLFVVGGLVVAWCVVRKANVDSQRCVSGSILLQQTCNYCCC